VNAKCQSVNAKFSGAGFCAGMGRADLGGIGTAISDFGRRTVPKQATGSAGASPYHDAGTNRGAPLSGSLPACGERGKGNPLAPLRVSRINRVLAGRRERSLEL
jgi:hypothetical protein